MRIVLALMLALFGSLPALNAAASGQTHVRALLVLASNEHGQTDSRLSAYEPTLRSILRFESYRLIGEGSADLAAGGKANVALAQGHSLDLQAETIEAKGVRLRLVWQDGGRTLMSTGLALRSGTPAVLGGPRNGKDGVWAIILVAE